MKIIKIFLILFIYLVTLHGETKDVSLQLLWKHQFEFAGFYMAKEKGFYKDVDLNVTFKEYDFGVDIIKDVENGNSTFGLSYPNIILEKAKGAKVNLIAAILQTSPHVLLSLESSNINSIQDFKNKKIMINENATASASFISMFQAEGLNLNSLQIIKPSFNINDLITKKIDIMSSFISNEPQHLEEKGIKYKVWNPKEYGFDFYEDLLFTSSSMVETNPEIVKNFTNASLKGWIYAFNHIEETVGIILDKYNSQNKTKKALLFEAQALKKLAFSKNNTIGDIDKNKIERILDIYRLLGITKSKINLDEFIFNPSYTQNQLTPSQIKYLKENPKIKICSNPSWEPIDFYDIDKKKNNGIAFDTLDLIQKKLNNTIEFEYIYTSSWKESQEFLKAKKCDILQTAIKTKKREEFALFTKPYLTYKLAIITQNNQSFINDINAILDKSIARNEGSGLIQKLKNLYPNINIVETKSYEESFQLVSHGKVYCTIATLPVAFYSINKLAITNLHIAGYTDMNYNLSIATRRDLPILCDIFDTMLANITPNEYKSINDKWIGKKLVESKDYSFIWKILVALFALILWFLYWNRKLKSEVRLRTQELELLNKTLEEKVNTQVEELRGMDLVLLEQSKMASMGEMIGNIAHQWRQPLSAISISATGMIVEKECGVLDDKTLTHNLEKINEYSQYLSRTIDTFRDYLKANKEYKEVHLVESIKQTFEIVKSVLDGKNIKLQKYLPQKDIKVKLIYDELSQVIINIINHAKDALEETPNENPWIKFNLSHENNMIFISIEDNAGGIPENIMEHIFEPYFTTKHKSQGTGLGLHMSYRIVHESLKGKLYVKNTSHGAKFFIEFPFGE